MPKKVKDDAGVEVEVFEKSEYDAAVAKAEEAERKFKEAEQEVNPNWREARKKIEALEKANEDKDKKLAEAGVKGNKVLDEGEVTKIAEAKAEEAYLKRYKDRVLTAYGEKREVVERYFDKLAKDEKLSEDLIDRLAMDAARTAGIQRTVNPDLAARYGRAGGEPRFTPENPDQGFGTTESGKATADAMGLAIEIPKDPSKLAKYGTS